MTKKRLIALLEEGIEETRKLRPKPTPGSAREAYNTATRDAYQYVLQLLRQIDEKLPNGAGGKR